MKPGTLNANDNVVYATEEELLCPICAEEFDDSDLQLFPCRCDYQICRWCLSRIIQLGNSGCPMCRTSYDENEYRTVSVRQIIRVRPREVLKQESLAAKPVESELKTKDDETHLNKRPSVYRLSNVPCKLLNAKDLAGTNFFGKYGPLHSVVCFSVRDVETAFIVFGDEEAAALAELDIQKFAAACKAGPFTAIRYVSGSAKFCAYSLGGLCCPMEKCMFIHRDLPQSQAGFYKVPIKKERQPQIEGFINDRSKPSLFTLSADAVERLMGVQVRPRMTVNVDETRSSPCELTELPPSWKKPKPQIAESTPGSAAFPPIGMGTRQGDLTSSPEYERPAMNMAEQLTRTMNLAGRARSTIDLAGSAYTAALRPSSSSEHLELDSRGSQQLNVEQQRDTRDLAPVITRLSANHSFLCISPLPQVTLVDQRRGNHETDLTPALDAIHPEKEYISPTAKHSVTNSCGQCEEKREEEQNSCDPPETSISPGYPPGFGQQAESKRPQIAFDLNSIALNVSPDIMFRENLFRWDEPSNMDSCDDPSDMGYDEFWLQIIIDNTLSNFSHDHVHDVSTIVDSFVARAQQCYNDRTLLPGLKPVEGSIEHVN